MDQFLLLCRRGSHILQFINEIILIELWDKSRHFLYPVNNENINMYNFLPFYCMTVFKCQGKTLNNITVWFDTNVVSPGAGYLAFSRVETYNQINLLTKVKAVELAPGRYNEVS